MQSPLMRDVRTPESKAFLSSLKDTRLVVVIQETWAYRVLLRKVKDYVWRSPLPDSSPDPFVDPLFANPAGQTATPSTTVTPSTATTSPSSMLSNSTLSSSTTSGLKAPVAKTKASKRHANTRKRTAKEAETLEKEKEQPPITLAQPECPNCKDEEMENRCIRLLPVVERADAKAMMGAAFTCVPKAERLKPRIPVRLDVSF